MKKECGACGGSGIYRGFAEPPGVAVVCLGCDGGVVGQRKIQKGIINKVYRSGGSFIATGVGPVGKPVTYEEFLAGKMPS